MIGIMCEKLKNFILGTHFDSEAENLRDLHRSRLSNDNDYKRDQEEKSQKYFNKNKTSFKSLLFDEGKDCAICISEFGDSDEVIQLPCNQHHVFHADCIQAMVGSSTQNNLRCPLCREPFVL